MASSQSARPMLDALDDGGSDAGSCRGSSVGGTPSEAIISFVRVAAFRAPSRRSASSRSALSFAAFRAPSPRCRPHENLGRDFFVVVVVVGRGVVVDVVL